MPRARVAGAEVPRQNTVLWELILGNYNPGDSTAVRGPTRADSEKHRQYRNVQIDLSSFIFTELSNVYSYSVLSTLRQYFCLNKINKLSKFDINSSG